MSGGKRRFFSGTSESQAAIEAAGALGVPAGDLLYRVVDKRGALRPGRVVIEVDPDSPRRPAGAAAEPAVPRPTAPAMQPTAPRVAAPRAERAPAEEGRYGGGRRDDRRGYEPRGGGRHEEGEPSAVVAAAAAGQATPPLAGAEGAREAGEALVALSSLQLAATARVDGDVVRVDLEGAGQESLVARQGELLRTFEYLLRRMARDTPEGGVTADSGGFRAEREGSLRRRAAAAAEEVRRTGEAVLLEPLGAAERRIVHLAIQDEPGVASASEGDGETKRIRVTRAD
jgi:spoIIIJ-associated protein